MNTTHTRSGPLQVNHYLEHVERVENVIKGAIARHSR